MLRTPDCELLALDFCEVFALNISGPHHFIVLKPRGTDRMPMRSSLKLGHMVAYPLAGFRTDASGAKHMIHPCSALPEGIPVISRACVSS